MTGQRGQATVEWTAVVLLVAVVLGGGATVAAALHAPYFSRLIRCAVLAGCYGEDLRLERAYGADAAAFVRAYAPGLVYERGTLSLPVDFRRCRSHRCSDADIGLASDVWRSRGGGQATVFTRVVDRRAQGGDLFVQYWLYYPDSTYLGPVRAAGRKMPAVIARTPAGNLVRRAAGHHADDWESYQVRVSPTGKVSARASAHHGYSGHRRWPNLNELPDSRLGIRRTGAWTSATGWTRVSRGSHAGHVVDGPGWERRTESDGLTLVPIEGLAAEDRDQPFAVKPPWRKGVYTDPLRTHT